jgi:hypothetical protein
MNTVKFPTSQDIYLEVNGKKVAIVQSYSAKSTRDTISVQAFGQSDPVGTIGGADSHTIQLTRLYATEDAISDGIRFHDLDDFSLVICKPDRKIIYSGCRWSSISESGELGAMVLEQVTLVAAKRMEVSL